MSDDIFKNPVDMKAEELLDDIDIIEIPYDYEEDDIEIIEIPEEDDDDTETPTVENSVQTPSMSWKDDKGLGNKEVISRSKINRKEALEQEAKDKTNLKNNDGKKSAPIEQMAAGLKKVSTKIKTNAYDEDDEDEKQIIGSANDNSLANALSEDERKTFNQKTNADTNRTLQAGEKMGALNAANQMSKQAGGKSIDSKTISEHMVDATYNKASMGRALNKNLSKELKISNPGKIPASKHKDLIKGIKRVKEKGGRVSGMHVEDVAKAAKANDKGVAEIIYKNTTTSDKKRIHEKADVKKLIEKTGRTSDKDRGKSIEKASIKEIEKGNVRLRPVERVREQNQR